MADTILYEYPLNERIRLLLRFEQLLLQFDYAAASTSGWNSRLALLTLFDVAELVSRSELRGELGKLLNRLRKSFIALRNHTEVDSSALDRILDDLDQAATALHDMYTGELDIVGQQVFLQMVRQRSTIPGGSCSFDLPALHHWLEATPPAERHRQLQVWTHPLAPLDEGTRLVLSLLRGSAYARPQQAERGRFQQSLDTQNAPQMLRLEVDPEQDVYPEISADPHRVSIRFLHQETPEQPAMPVDRTIPFRLAYCRV